MSAGRFIIGDVFDVLATLEDNSVDLVLSSPPFLALRSYLPADHPDKGREIGSEPTPADFLDRLLDVVEECGRVLAPHGSLVFELGDTYSGSGGGGGDYLEGGWREGQQQFAGSAASMRESNAAHWRPKNAQRDGWPLDKSLCGIPTLFAWSLAYGRNLLRPERTTDRWRVRNVVAWCRPNPPVGALGDKFRPATSFLTVATRSRDRWFDLDAVRVPLKDSPGNRYMRRVSDGDRDGRANATPGIEREANKITKDYNPADSAGAPPLDWWEIPTQPYKGAHYATWPEALCARPIESMCPRKVCRTCGEPSRRIVERARTLDGDVVEGLPPLGRETQRRRQNGEAGNRRYGSVVVADGWSDCGHGDWRPGVVLDPFAGSGTTLAVAVGHGRDAIGIDLDSRNAELARERVGMLLTVEAPELERRTGT